MGMYHTQEVASYGPLRMVTAFHFLTLSFFLASLFLIGGDSLVTFLATFLSSDTNSLASLAPLSCAKLLQDPRSSLMSTGLKWYLAI